MNKNSLCCLVFVILITYTIFTIHHQVVIICKVISAYFLGGVERHFYYIEDLN